MLALRIVKKFFKCHEKRLSKFGHVGGNWSKKKDLLYFSYQNLILNKMVIKTPKILSVENAQELRKLSFL